MCNVPEGSFDNVSECRYDVPDYWTIGEVYERLIEDVTDGDVVKTLFEVYSSWIDSAISNYNSDFFLSVPRLFERMLPRGRGIGIKNGRDSAIFYI